MRRSHICLLRGAQQQLGFTDSNNRRHRLRDVVPRDALRQGPGLLSKEQKEWAKSILAQERANKKSSDEDWRAPALMKDSGGKI